MNITKINVDGSLYDVASDVEVSVDYNSLINTPQINGKNLMGDQTSQELDLASQAAVIAAQTSADNASGVAQQAISDASAAQTTANTAATNASSALSTANNAIANAATAQSRADSAYTMASGKITTFYQTSQPTATTTGDLWIDTDDGNKLYRWNGSSWVDVQDDTIQAAYTLAGDAKSIADGKIVTFAQTSMPTATDLGDLWVDTDDSNKLYRWNGSNWVSVRDGTIATAQTTANTAITNAATAQSRADAAYTLANGKNKVIYSNSQPSTDGRIEGDIWFNPSNGYKMSRFTNGAWSEALFSSAAFSEITAGKISAGTIQSAVEATNLTMSGGKINITTDQADYDAINLNYGAFSLSLMPELFMMKQGTNSFINISPLVQDGWLSINSSNNGLTLGSNHLTITNSGAIYLYDDGVEKIPAICYNGHAIWIGALQASSAHHSGGTYISSGHNGTSGNSTIYVSVPNADNDNSTNYGVWHAGNFTPPSMTTPTITKNTVSGVSSSTISVKQWGKVVSVDISITLTAVVSTQSTLATGFPAPVDGVRTQEFLPSPSSYSRPLRFIMNTSGQLDIRYGAAGTFYHHFVYLAS